MGSSDETVALRISILIFFGKSVLQAERAIVVGFVRGGTEF